MCGPADTGMLAAPVPPIAQRPPPTSAMGSFAQCCDPSPNDPAFPAHLTAEGLAQAGTDWRGTKRPTLPRMARIWWVTFGGARTSAGDYAWLPVPL